MRDIDLFDESLCNMRWTASCYHRRKRIFLKKLDVGPSKAPQFAVATKPKKMLNRNKRFRETNEIYVKIVSLVSDVGIHYQRRIELLHNLAYMWGENQEVLIKSVDHESKFLLLLLHKIYFGSLAKKYSSEA